jgi:cysteine desulfurase
MIYLDNNASTPVDPEVSDAIFSALRREYGNPSSVHDVGRKAHQLLESCRKSVADLLGCSPDEIIFTSGGTESNNLAILGTASQHGKGHLITSAVEHPSVLEVCRHLEKNGFSVTYVGTDRKGVVDLERLKDSIREDTVLISVMHANNETGVIQPVEEIGKIAEKHGIAFHSDAAQTIGKIPFTLPDSGIDMLTVAAHKLYGPKGVGALYMRKGLTLRPLLFGAGHEKGLRPGTENVPGIAGLAKACLLSSRDIRLRVSHTTHLSNLLFSALKNALHDIRLNGHSTQRLPNTMNILIPGVLSYELVGNLKDNVALSSGSACHAGLHTPSSVLRNMGLSEADALSSLRISVGKDNTDEEMETAASLIIETVREIRNKPSQTILSSGP